MSDANASVIMDSLLQRGRIRPFIVACPSLQSEEDLLRYFVPFVDATFRTIPKRESRAIAGHSSGGFTAMDLSLAHPEAFSISGAFAPIALLSIAPNISTAQGLKPNPISFWLYAGRKDTMAISWAVKGFAGELRKNGQSTMYVEDDGDHIKNVARRLSELIEYVFKHLTWE